MASSQVRRKSIRPTSIRRSRSGMRGGKSRFRSASRHKSKRMGRSKSKRKSKRMRRSKSRHKNVIGPMRRGTLTNFGYNSRDTATLRHSSVQKAVRAHSALEVFRKLNAISILNRNTNPTLAKHMLADRNWVRSNFM